MSAVVENDGTFVSKDVMQRIMRITYMREHAGNTKGTRVSMVKRSGCFVF